MSPPPGVETTADLGDLWLILSRRRRAILATAALFALAGLLYGIVATPLYTASTQILIDPRDRHVVTNDVNDGTVAPDGGVTQVESQVKVMQSNAVLLRAVAQAGLEDDAEFGAPGHGLLARLKHAASGVFGAGAERDPRSEALDALRRKIAVKRADKVFVVDVLVTTSDPDKSARIADAIAQAYLADQAEARAQAATRASAALGARLDGLRQDVEAAQTRLDAYRAGNGLIASNGRLVGEQQLTDINLRLVAAQTRTAEAKSRLQKVRDLGGRLFDPGATPEAVSSVVVERLRAQYADLSSKEADLRIALAARHPALLAVEAQRADVKRLIDAELARIAQSSETDYRRAAANESMLRASLTALQSDSVKTSRASGRMRDLEQDVDTRRTVYNDFLLRSREVGEQAGIDSTNARVIGGALVPKDASWPPRAIIVLTALFGGLSIGSGLAMAREYWRPTLLSRGQLERLLNAPVLATLPAPRGLLDGAAAMPAALAIDGLRCLDRPHGGTRGRSIMVTASTPDAALRHRVVDLLAAVAVARGERVLVVDADLGGADAGEAGLIEALRGEGSLVDAVWLDASTGASWIGLGRREGATQEAFRRDNVHRFLDHVGEAFDLAIVDGGALSTNLAAGSLAAAVDQILVVASSGTTLQRDALDLAKAAAVIGRPVTGSLLVDEGAAA